LKSVETNLPHSTLVFPTVIIKIRSMEKRHVDAPSGEISMKKILIAASILVGMTLAQSASAWVAGGYVVTPQPVYVIPGPPPPAVVYGAPAPVYAAPPVVYTAPPVYAAPPVVYGPPAAYVEPYNNTAAIIAGAAIVGGAAALIATNNRGYYGGYGGYGYRGYNNGYYRGYANGYRNGHYYGR
jgi:hypothetical protein